MLGRTRAILRYPANEDGVIADFSIMRKMYGAVINKVHETTSCNRRRAC
jgi:actin-like ATPase involved in cell morphogenesis